MKRYRRLAKIDDYDLTTGGGAVKICDANPNRISLIVQAKLESQGRAALHPDSGAGNPSIHLQPGDTLTIDHTQEMWATTGDAISIRVLEIRDDLP